jgi:hypothetical protein
MDGKVDAAGAGTGPLTPDVAVLMLELNRRLADAAEGSLEEIERTARAVTAMAKAVQTVTALTARDQTGSDDTGTANEGLDAEGEQRLRDQFLGRLDALAAALELEGLDPCPACGRFEPSRAGLEQLVGTGAEDTGR